MLSKQVAVHSRSHWLFMQWSTSISKFCFLVDIASSGLCIYYLSAFRFPLLARQVQPVQVVMGYLAGSTHNPVWRGRRTLFKLETTLTLIPFSDSSRSPLLITPGIWTIEKFCFPYCDSESKMTNSVYDRGQISLKPNNHPYCNTFIILPARI